MEWRWRVSIVRSRQNVSIPRRHVPQAMPFGHARFAAGEVTWVTVPVDLVIHP